MILVAPMPRNADAIMGLLVGLGLPNSPDSRLMQAGKVVSHFALLTPD